MIQLNQINAKQLFLSFQFLVMYLITTQIINKAIVFFFHLYTYLNNILTHCCLQEVKSVHAPEGERKCKIKIKK